MNNYQKIVEKDFIYYNIIAKNNNSIKRLGFLCRILDISVLGPGHFGTDLDSSGLG
jgi:hypothetical protein